jgi:uncharacterized protein YhbP (UPF0306 family)
MIKDVEKTIREYLPGIIHLSLATSNNNKPWVCEVHYVFDNDLNLYFRSLPSRRHSKDIEENNQVAGNIVKQHVHGQKPRAVYFEGRAEMLNEVDENHIAYKLYCERFDTDRAILDEARTADGHKFYKISAAKYYLFDSVESTPSKKYELVWGK